MHIRFETSRRYYIARLDKDLLGDWVVQVCNGGKFNRLGKIVTRPVATEAEGVRLLAAIATQRVKRHYCRV